jgi:hypothetical protein
MGFLFHLEEKLKEFVGHLVTENLPLGLQLNILAIDNLQI